MGGEKHAHAIALTHQGNYQRVQIISDIIAEASDDCSIPGADEQSDKKRKLTFGPVRMAYG
jgi:hypothetical protein